MKFHLPARAGAMVAASLLLSVSAQAQNIVVNGGFEAGTLNGWAAGGDASFTGVAQDIGHSGDWAAYAGPNPTGSLSQLLNTTPGQLYDVRFWLRLDDSAAPNAFSWSFGNVAQGQALTNVGAFDYVSYSATVTAAAATSLLRFDFSNPQSFWLIDDISVTAVPEPGAAVLLSIGLLSLALLRRRVG